MGYAVLSAHAGELNSLIDANYFRLKARSKSSKSVLSHVKIVWRRDYQPRKVIQKSQKGARYWRAEPPAERRFFGRRTCGVHQCLMIRGQRASLPERELMLFNYRGENMVRDASPVSGWGRRGNCQSSLPLRIALRPDGADAPRTSVRMGPVRR